MWGWAELNSVQNTISQYYVYCAQGITRWIPVRCRETGAGWIGVIPEQGKLFPKGGAETVVLRPEFPEGEHPQAHRDGVVRVRARDVDVGTRAGQLLDHPQDLGFQLQFAPAAIGTAQERRRLVSLENEPVERDLRIPSDEAGPIARTRVWRSTAPRAASRARTAKTRTGRDTWEPTGTVYHHRWDIIPAGRTAWNGT